VVQYWVPYNKKQLCTLLPVVQLETTSKYRFTKYASISPFFSIVHSKVRSEFLGLQITSTKGSTTSNSTKQRRYNVEQYIRKGDQLKNTITSTSCTFKSKIQYFYIIYRVLVYIITCTSSTLRVASSKFRTCSYLRCRAGIPSSRVRSDM
jgi:hypothetical protein